MYVITFYSFKGGVGRTMALVNVAAELVRRGRKVLVVDFDLEAPGLETYKHLRPKKPHPGIVEYITEYRRSNAVPNLLDYIYETDPIGKRGGRLWVMPAGRRDGAYRSALSRLDWQSLYKKEDGFLLFEDTKIGWDEELHPDYVLIDSRTGDTEVLGICTRQLPDAVVLMFTPNEQNLAGLENVVRDIRREETEGLKKKIRLHFVAANLPDVDDDKGILRRQLQAFQTRLQFLKPSARIRRYESLQLLDQRVFVVDRPSTRLAASYRKLVYVLLKDNLADRAGALAFLDNYRERMESRSDDFGDVEAEGWTIIFEEDGQQFIRDGAGDRVPNRPQVEDRRSLSDIARLFPDDVEIINLVAERFIWEKGYRQALWVLDGILERKPNTGSWYQRALCKMNLGQAADAAEDFLQCYRFSRTHSHNDGSGPREVRWHLVKQDCLQKFCAMASPAKLAQLEVMFDNKELADIERWLVTRTLCQRQDGALLAGRLLRKQIASGDRVDTDSLLLAHCWQEVIDREHEIRSQEGSAALCLALAYWGRDGELPQALCKEALDAFESEQKGTEDYTPRFGDQAPALLFWRLGEVSTALRLLDKAEDKARSKTVGELFSLWRMGDVPAQQYVDDCRAWRRLFEGDSLRPAFVAPDS